MKECKIGIIEDTPEELNSIERTIYSHLFKDYNLVYKEYELNNKLFDNGIVEEIESDILNENIMLLIVDNKLIVEGNRLKGTSIYESVKRLASDFPIIIMTNYKDEAYDNDYVDPDKIYDKENFFMNQDYTKEKIKSISLMIDKYNKLRNNIFAEKKRLIEEYEKEVETSGQETLNELLKLEIEMKKYTPVDCSYLEELISPTYVKEIVDLLDEVKSKLD